MAADGHVKKREKSLYANTRFEIPSNPPNEELHIRQEEAIRLIEPLARLPLCNAVVHGATSPVDPRRSVYKNGQGTTTRTEKKTGNKEVEKHEGRKVVG